MCGIAGQIKKSTPIDVSNFALMVNELAHRGPDGSGVKYLNENKVALGHRRLSIIDLTSTGSQPMTNEDETIWLTYNGEIYNYRSLRSELVALGHQFRSSSDSEVIIHAFESWGPNCVKRFRGIFAFALYNLRDQSLFLARDHMGVKPLYYFHGANDFIFASESRAIIKSSDFNLSLNTYALSLYMAYGNVPAEFSIYDGISKLLPGNYLLYKDGHVSIHRYWKLIYNPTIKEFGAAEDRIKTAVEDAIKAQSVSDVPIGTLLSGGIDSTAITGILCNTYSSEISSFTIGFDDPSSNESQYARQVSNKLGTRHHESILDYDAACSSLPDIINAFDEPFHLNGLFPYFSLSKLVRSNQFKVVFGGDGADELFSGYLWYEGFHKQVMQRRQKSTLAASLRKLIFPKRLTPAARDYEIFFRYNGSFTPTEQREILGTNMKHIEPDKIFDILRRHWQPQHSPVLAAQLLDFNCFMVDHCLTKVDRASMAFGVEVRVPFLDIDLVNLIYSIDHDIVFEKAIRKALLKKALKHYLPRDMDQNRKKGFSSPVESWLNKGMAMRGKNLILDGSLCQRDLINADKLKTNYDSYHHSKKLMLLSAELWCRRWIDNDAAAISIFSESLSRNVNQVK